MANFRLILIFILGIALIEALPALKPTSKPGGKSISKLRSLSSKNKGLLAEEKKISSSKASKIAVENAEELKKGDRKKKSTTFCVEIRPDPTDKICDPAPSTIIHEHHMHNPIPPHQPVPSVNPAPPVNPAPHVNPAPPVNPDQPEIPIIINPQPQPSINVQPSPPLPPTTIILQPKPTLGCITSSLVPCPPSLFPSIYSPNGLQSSPGANDIYFADPVLGAINVEEPSNPIDQPSPPYYDSQSVVVEYPETPSNARTVERKQEYIIHSRPQPSYQTLYLPQNYRQHQTTESCDAGKETWNPAGYSPDEKYKDLPIPTGPVLPPPINVNFPLGGYRGLPLYPKTSLSDSSSFRIISNPPNAVFPLGYQTLYRSYDPRQGSSGLPIPSDQSSNTQQIRLQRQQKEEPETDESEEELTSEPESPAFSGLLNKLRASKESWQPGPTMQTFAREKTDQIQQLRTQAAQVNVNLPSSEHSIAPTNHSNNEDQSIISSLKKIGQKEIESALNTSEGKHQ